MLSNIKSFCSSSQRELRVEKYINKKEIIPALLRVVYGAAVAYLVFIGRFGTPTERMEFALAAEVLTLMILLLSVFMPERWRRVCCCSFYLTPQRCCSASRNSEA